MIRHLKIFFEDFFNKFVLANKFSKVLILNFRYKKDDLGSYDKKHK